MSKQWILVSDDGRAVALDRHANAYLTSKQDPRGHVVFDERDNVQIKLPFYEQQLGVKLSVEFVS